MKEDDINRVMDLADEIQQSIHEEIEAQLVKNPKLTYQDAMNTCLILRLAILQYKQNNPETFLRVPTFQLVAQFCEKHKLSEEIKKGIEDLTKAAYVRGANDTTIR